jgi:hypothetical protein
LVEDTAEEKWRELDDAQRRATFAVVGSGEQIRIASQPTQRLIDLGVQNGAMFHLHGVPVSSLGPTGLGGGRYTGPAYSQ